MDKLQSLAWGLSDRMCLILASFVCCSLCIWLVQGPLNGREYGHVSGDSVSVLCQPRLVGSGPDPLPQVASKLPQGGGWEHTHACYMWLPSFKGVLPKVFLGCLCLCMWGKGTWILGARVPSGLCYCLGFANTMVAPIWGESGVLCICSVCMFVYAWCLWSTYPWLVEVPVAVPSGTPHPVLAADWSCTCPCPLLHSLWQHLSGCWCWNWMDAVIDSLGITLIKHRCSTIVAWT